LPLAEKWRPAFDAKHPGVEMEVAGGGSGTGIRALIDGSASIAMSSREISREEQQEAQARGVYPKPHIVAYDGIAVIVNPANQIKALSIEQISDIYTGKITNWGAVGSPQTGKIVVVSRDSASGTYEAFKDLVVTLHGRDKSRDYAASALKQASNQAVLTTVAATTGAIGYVGLGYLNQSVRAVDVIPLSGGAPVPATPETVSSGAYPISRPLYLYTNGEPQGVIREFIDWVLGPEGQRIVEDTGFVPVQHK